MWGGKPDGPADWRAALRADDPLRQDQRAHGGAVDSRRAVLPREDRTGPVHRDPYVRDHGGLHHGRASAWIGIQSAAGGAGLCAGTGAVAAALPYRRWLSL